MFQIDESVHKQSNAILLFVRLFNKLILLFPMFYVCIILKRPEMPLFFKEPEIVWLFKNIRVMAFHFENRTNVIYSMWRSVLK